MDVSTISPKGLAVLLGTTYGQIIRFYYRTPIRSYYTSFDIPKKNGGSRSIDAPAEQLKALQNKLLVLLQPLYKPRKHIHGFVNGRSIVSNARQHVRRKYVFNVDIEDFFGSITFARVRGMLMAKPYNFRRETATVISHLCCLDGKLPQGAPTSPILSNMLCGKLDAELAVFAARLGFSYTRYADDITFSFDGNVERACGVLFEKPDAVPIEYVKNLTVADPLYLIFHNNGFSVNQSKVRLESSRQKQVVTGLIVNKIVNVDRRYIRTTAAMIHSIEMTGELAAQEKFSASGGDVSFIAHLAGRLLFIRQVKGAHSSVYLRLAHRFNDLALKFSVPLKIPRKNSSTDDHRRRRKIAKFTWAIEVNQADDILEGSAFSISSGLLITNAHVFPSNGAVDSIEVFKPGEQKFPAKVLHICFHRDLAVLEIDSDQRFPGFELQETESEHELGYSKLDTVIVAGYPSASRSQGKSSVNVFFADISTTYTASLVEYAVIDKGIKEGNSGGPVINESIKVVGVASRGVTSEGAGVDAFVGVRTLRTFIGELGSPKVRTLDNLFDAYLENEQDEQENIGKRESSVYFRCNLRRKLRIVRVRHGANCTSK